ncbi:MAG: hypothetical protein WD226_12025 [Planctomycetota bacterium]
MNDQPRKEEPAREPRPGLFRDVVLAPDRDADLAPRPIVSLHEEDEAAYRREVSERETARVTLHRRGVEHGTYAVLDPAGLMGPRLRRKRREALERERWFAARPIMLEAQFEQLARETKGLARGLFERLARGEFESWLAARASALEPRFVREALETAPAALADPERDLARAGFSTRDGLADFWIKLARLSTHPDDRSLRLRLSFGQEGEDDASLDEERHGVLAEIARPLLPGFTGVEHHQPVVERLAALVGAPILFTQPIGYWNVAGGGARFHHDSFGENDGQRGVLFVQLTGRSFWLALSIRDLADRLREFVGEETSETAELARRPAAALAELALPDCGRFGELIDAPSFTAFLADAGHAVLLEPGDAIVLPNHGPDRTAMHSVFGVARRPAYGLSLAIRAR